MSEADLKSYNLQMQQVEAALTSDPGNQELLTLKADLEQVIELTRTLIEQQRDLTSSTSASSSSTSAAAHSSAPDDDDQEVQSSAEAKKERPHDHLTPVKHWQVGEQCQAIWTKNGQYYEATINEITTDGEVSVTFEQYGNTGVTTLGLLKISSLGFTASASSANRKEQLAKQREYLKKKKAKKAERYKNMEKEREQEKNKWQNFSNKAFGKKGFVKKSIFKTPENATGRVGIGTCGVGGAEMTKFSGATKHYKR